MTDRILRKIRMDIHNNFGKKVDWSSIPTGNFNCYMFAIFNTVSTETLDCVKDGKVFLNSLIHEEVMYFGRIGQFSGNTRYSTVPEVINAWKGDLRILGILAEECSLDEKLPNGYVKVAFFYDINNRSNFHFIRQEGEKWIHKPGWFHDVEELEVPIEKFFYNGLELIGIFRLSLIKDCG